MMHLDRFRFCQICGSVFIASLHNRLTCSKECRREASRRYQNRYNLARMMTDSEYRTRRARQKFRYVQDSPRHHQIMAQIAENLEVVSRDPESFIFGGKEGLYRKILQPYSEEQDG